MTEPTRLFLQDDARPADLLIRSAHVLDLSRTCCEK